MLLIHAENDRVVNVQDAHALFTAARGPKELWLIPDAAHAMAYLTEQSAYADRVREFFDRWLPAAFSEGDTEVASLDAAAG